MVYSSAASSQFQEYIGALEKLAQGREIPSPAEWRRKLTTCLDGEPGQILRREEESSRLRQLGAYFTGAKLATRLANTLTVKPDSREVYFDPTCGAGDLLLAVAKKLPVADTLQNTIDVWSKRLAGCEISPDFVRLAKARLVLLAARRCRIRPRAESVALASVFPDIVEADFFSCSNDRHCADVVIMNPPFGYTRATAECEWAKGRINAAAIFTERAIRGSSEGTRTVAILPDVLRSGSRYNRWRAVIEALGSVRCERPLGLFARWADVDVYLLDFLKTAGGTTGTNAANWSRTKGSGGVGRRFAVHVGPLVPHRHKETGPEVRYIHARSLPAWEEYKCITESRKFSGRLFEPPFVAVRRTSRPDDKRRAVATLILGDRAVAVENHLIVLLPRDGTTGTCRRLMARLRSSRTDYWVNGRLRCRHLTTTVLAEMPWWNRL